jgi:hypothetical protein
MAIGATTRRPENSVKHGRLNHSPGGWRLRVTRRSQLRCYSILSRRVMARRRRALSTFEADVRRRWASVARSPIRARCDR